MDGEQIVSSELTDKIWKNWLIERHMADGLISFYSKSSYQMIPRKWIVAQKFETWLFMNGLSVVQKNRKRMIIARNEENLTLFLLRYT